MTLTEGFDGDDFCELQIGQYSFECVLTVAALTAESFLKACCPVHTRLAAWHHDLVGVGFGASEGRRVRREE